MDLDLHLTNAGLLEERSHLLHLAPFAVDLEDVDRLGAVLGLVQRGVIAVEVDREELEVRRGLLRHGVVEVGPVVDLNLAVGQRRVDAVLERPVAAVSNREDVARRRRRRHGVEAHELAAVALRAKATHVGAVGAVRSPGVPVALEVLSHALLVAGVRFATECAIRGVVARQVFILAGEQASPCTWLLELAGDGAWILPRPGAWVRLLLLCVICLGPLRGNLCRLEPEAAHGWRVTWPFRAVALAGHHTRAALHGQVDVEGSTIRTD
mmetsp:Transcript_22899/g.50065  ORF Transcript_22899/g.50065 Transcript_22899/m.50065 type:complete len:267 (-) Transcript_22899:299-1099(-)